jgi:hypothetical protein
MFHEDVLRYIQVMCRLRNQRERAGALEVGPPLTLWRIRGHRKPSSHVRNQRSQKWSQKGHWEL